MAYSKCNTPEKCSIKEYCFRFTYKGNDLYQPYITPRLGEDGKCEDFLTNSRFDTEIAKHIKTFAAAGPVNQVTTAMKAKKAYDKIEAFLTGQEVQAITVGVSHAHAYEGRAEFDAVMKTVIKRLIR
jgi:hypothetical protein